MGSNTCINNQMYLQIKSNYQLHEGLAINFIFLGHEMLFFRFRFGNPEAFWLQRTTLVLDRTTKVRIKSWKRSCCCLLSFFVTVVKVSRSNYNCKEPSHASLQTAVAVRVRLRAWQRRGQRLRVLLPDVRWGASPSGGSSSSSDA